MAHVLIIDDDPLFSRHLSQTVAALGHETVVGHTLSQGRALATQESYDVVFLDVHLPDGNGLSAITHLQTSPGQPEIIIITGEGEVDGAALAIESGAWDYIEKPATQERMTFPLLRALDYRHRKSSSRPVLFHRNGIVGSSPTMESCLGQVARAAASDANVLVRGETGVGKEIIARAIHVNSRRVERPFVVVDCGSLPESLLEAELFGNVKGAYTGADHFREGLIAQAHGGTLFLDEIGELPITQQSAFLRVLQERKFRPLGGGEEQYSDFRLIAATNQDLESMAEKGHFRQDLYFRINSQIIRVPPLREREGDIHDLAKSRLEQLCQRYQFESKSFSQDFLNALNAYSWPGNVRELFNALEHALSAAQADPQLYQTHLPTHIRVEIATSEVRKTDKSSVAESTAAYSDTPPPWKDFRQKRLDAAEREYLQQLLTATEGNVTKASEISGLSRQRVHALMRKHGFQRTLDLSPQ